MRTTLAFLSTVFLGCHAHTASKSAAPEMVSIYGSDQASNDQAPPPTQVHGSLDKEVIRSGIRPHLREVKSCYETALAQQPALDGRLMVQFTIAGAGNVVAAVVQSSTLNNPSVETCITTAVRGWSFPKPVGGGIVVVSYPFVLRKQGAP